MKKLTALLVACAMMTCAFVSCGNDNADESPSEKSVSETEAETEASTAEETSGEESSEEETTELETTEQETEEETTESASAEATDESIIGMWAMEEDGTIAGMNFIDDSRFSMWIDITDMAHFTSDGDFIIDGEAIDSDLISYDGTTFSINAEGQDLWTMTKESGSPDSYDGEYKLVSGLMYDSVALYEGVDVYVIVNGETMLADYRNILTYTVDGNKISMSGLDKIDANENGTLDTTYEIKDGTLTLKDFDEDGDCVMTRFDPSDITTVPSQKTTAGEISISDEDRTTEGSVTGAWYSVDDTYGFRFAEDGTGSVFVDATEMLHFTADGKFFVSTMTLEPENIQYDGTRLSVNVQGTDMLTMTRNDGSNPDSFDGEYTFESGAFYEGVVTSMGESFGVKPEEAVVHAVVDGEKMFVEFAGLFSYSADDGSLAFEGLESLGIPDGSAVLYKFSGNNLIFTDGVDEEMILEKIDL